MTDEQRALARFYAVNTKDELISAQARHIEKLQAGTSYWLIERQTSDHCEWFVRWKSNSNGKVVCGEWTTDASKALQFNERGAKQYAMDLENMSVKGPFLATQHIDCARIADELKEG